MTRGLTSGQEAAATGAHSRQALLIEAIFDSGTIRGNSAGVNIPVSAVTYPAVNVLRSIEPFGESTGSTEGVRIVLDGVDAAILTLAAAEPYRGRPLNVYEVWLDEDLLPIDSPVLLFPGLMASMAISEEAGTASVVLEAEHLERDLRRPRELRFNDADHRLLYTGDKGFEWAEQTTELVGVDLAADLRGLGEWDALRVIKQAGGVPALAAARLRQREAPAFAQRGDVVVTLQGGRETLGVVCGPDTWCAPGVFGLVFRPVAEALVAFEV